MIITVNQAIELKAVVKVLFQAEVHYHDACSGQFFTLDEKNDELREYIIEYFKKQDLRAVFSSDGIQFYIEEL